MTSAPSFPGLAKVLAGKAFKGVKDNVDYYRGSGIIDSLLTSGVKGSPWQVDIKKAVKLLTDPELWAPVNKMPVADAKKPVQYSRQAPEPAESATKIVSDLFSKWRPDLNAKI